MNRAVQAAEQICSKYNPYGNGDERIQKLTEAGLDYNVVQGYINRNIDILLKSDLMGLRGTISLQAYIQKNTWFCRMKIKCIIICRETEMPAVIALGCVMKGDRTVAAA